MSIIFLALVWGFDVAYGGFAFALCVQYDVSSMDVGTTLHLSVCRFLHGFGYAITPAGQTCRGFHGVGSLTGADVSRSISLNICFGFILVLLLGIGSLVGRLG